MKLHIRAIGMDLNDSTRTYATEKFSRLAKFLAPNQDEAAVADINLIYAPSNTKDSKDKCHAIIDGLGGGRNVHIETEEPEMHVAIDAAVQKMEEQLRRDKERHRDRLHKGDPEAKHIPPEDLMDTAPVEPGTEDE